MAISSRTPEGTPNRCPVCGSEVRIEPTQPFGDAPCPVCGILLWFVAVGSETRYFVTTDELVEGLLAERLGVSLESLRGGRWRELGIDSLDVVELIMELEEELGVGPPSWGR
jgi:acyl carrier protein